MFGVLALAAVPALVSVHRRHLPIPARVHDRVLSDARFRPGVVRLVDRPVAHARESGIDGVARRGRLHRGPSFASRRRRRAPRVLPARVDPRRGERPGLPPRFERRRWGIRGQRPVPGTAGEREHARVLRSAPLVPRRSAGCPTPRRTEAASSRTGLGPHGDGDRSVWLEGRHGRLDRRHRCGPALPATKRTDPQRSAGGACGRSGRACSRARLPPPR